MDYVPTEAFLNDLRRNQAEVMLQAAANPRIAAQFGRHDITAEDIRSALGDEAAEAWQAIRDGYSRYRRAVAPIFATPAQPPQKGETE
jgi:hypothetical protein